MPRKRKDLKEELIAELLKDHEPMDAAKVLVSDVLNAALRGEMADHLDYEPGEKPPEEQSNRRNGVRKKTVKGNLGPMEIEVPRDREGTFEPKLIERYKRVIPGFDEKIIALYGRGMSTRDIRAFFEEEYGVDVSPDLVSRVTHAVWEEVTAWQSRSLQAVYPIVYLDALVVKVRNRGPVENKSLYLVIGVDEDGNRDVLGLWLQKTEGAKFWLSILNDLKQRGVEDILFLCADGLTGLPEAVEAAFPKTIFQTCVVHLIRSSTRLVPWKDKRAVCRDLKTLYTAASIEAAEQALNDFEDKWGARYPMVQKAWRTRWAEWTPFLAYPAEIRRAIYTTNVIEAAIRQIRKVLKTKGHLPSDEAAIKLVYLVLRNNQEGWRKTRRVHAWSTVKLQLSIFFEGRFDPA